MPRFLAACALVAAVVLTATTAAAQERPRAARRDTTSGPSLPADVTREVVELYNAAATTRVAGPLSVPAGRTITGDVAVLGGPATVAGHVTGRLLAINADVVFERGARVDGDVIVVGGVVDGRGQATLGGDLTIHRQVLYYRRDGERLIADAPAEEGASRWWPRRRSDERGRWAEVSLSSTGTYNRVEGLPIQAGVTLTAPPIGVTRTKLDALAIIRTAGGFDLDSGSIGHILRLETQVGRGRGLRVGGRLFDEIAPVESWKLGDGEVGLASFFLHRDFRDYYSRHGGSAYVSLFAGEHAAVTLSFSDERWASRAARDPWTLFRNSSGWRPNPRMDDARMHVASATVRVDTRNDEATPWAGWYLDLELERGRGDVTTFGALSADVSPNFPPTPLPGARDLLPGKRGYTRGFLDVRRYNRLSPEAQLNLRLATGGWLGGDALPLQRRFAVTGPGALPGFDFRRPTALSTDVGQCTVLGLQPAGTPAQCERFALAQVEFRGALHVGLPFGDSLWERVAVHTAVNWVLFADAGRGWLIGDAYEDLVYRAGQLPRASSFLADVGGGIDFGSGGVADVVSFGVYVGKSVTRPGQPANVFVRVRRRF
jgi:hypothetical protein